MNKFILPIQINKILISYIQFTKRTKSIGNI